MHADTSAINAFGTSQRLHAAALDDIGATLASARELLTGAPLGRAGAHFTAVLADAVHRHSQRIADVSRAVVDAAGTADATSVAYLAADSAHGSALDAAAT